jgi:histidinol-phosphate aminotransferase
MRDFTHDLKAMAAAIDARTPARVRRQPEQPTGTWNRKAELEALVAALPASCLLLLDEAYFEYAEDPDYPNGIELVRRGARGDRDAHVLEGLRLAGPARRYAVAAPRCSTRSQMIREAFGMNLRAGGGRSRARRRGACAPLGRAEPHREGAADGGASGSAAIACCRA